MVHKGGGGGGQIFPKIGPHGLRMTPNHKSQPTIFDVTANRTSDNHTKPHVKNFKKTRVDR